jgi:non-ribosomal peptide synthetase component F
MRQAWGSVQQAVAEDLTGAESLRQYRAGGGSIRTQDWYQLTRLATEALEAPYRASLLPSEMVIPESAFVPVDQDFSAKLKFKQEIYYTDPKTGERARKVVSVMSDEALPLELWQEEIAASATNYGVDTEASTTKFGRNWLERRG